MNILIEFVKNSLKDFLGFFLKGNVPNLRPRPKEIITAGSSNIPWGTNLNKEREDSTSTVIADTNPKRYPFTIAVITGKIPKINPKIIPKKLV